MRKIFTLLMVAISVITMAAQESKVLFDDPDAAMLSWSVACSVSAADVEGIKAGDEFIVTVNARKEGCDWPKFGFTANGKENYPKEFEMWGDKTFPLEATYKVTEADLELLKNGFDIKGDGVQITKVVFVKNVVEELPEGQTLLFDNANAPMLSWSVLCSITAAQVEGIKAGDEFIVTVNARKEGNDWPKFGFVANGKDEYPEEFEMWGDKTFPYEATYSVTADDVALLKDGFDIKGDGVQITRIVFVSSDPDADKETVLWKGEPTLMTWGAGPTVAAGKVAAIEAGDILAITITEINSGENIWPKVVCRSENGWDEIFAINLFEEEYANVEFPFVNEVVVTDEMLPLIKPGFNFGGEYAYISKVALVKRSSTSIDETFVNDAPAVVSVYTLSGVCVRQNVEAASATTGLPAGIYIAGGKKVLVK